MKYIFLAVGIIAGLLIQKFFLIKPADFKNYMCPINNGSRQASVMIYDSLTGKLSFDSAEVEADHCDIVRIDLTKGKRLSRKHFHPASINYYGECWIRDDSAKSYFISIVADWEDDAPTGRGDW